MTPALSVSDGQSWIATSGVLILYRCINEKLDLCIHSDVFLPTDASDLTVTLGKIGNPA
jgi:hypothetical protein